MPQLISRIQSFSVTASEADKLLSLDGDAALLYLLILRNGGRFDRKKAGALKLRGSVEEALRSLVSGGLIGPPKAKRHLTASVSKTKGTPTVTRAASPDAAEQERKRLKKLLDDVSQKLGKILSAEEMGILQGLYCRLRLPAELILFLLDRSLRDCERKKCRPSLKQLEKTAYLWADRGIRSVAAAEAYLSEETKNRELTEAIKRRLGLGDRALTSSEERYLTAWLGLGFGPDAVGEAYERTLAQKHTLVWPYMNRILEDWHGRGLISVEQIAREDPGERRRRETAEAQPSGPQADEFERMKRFIERMGGSGSPDA